MSFSPPGSVMLVDDDPVVRAAITQSLELAGLVVAPFAGAREALGRVVPNYNGVIVSDIRMPEIDGLQFFKAVREIDPTIPFILITGHGDIPMAVAALQDGADDFIAKPFASGHLVASVQRGLSRRQLELDNRVLRSMVEQAGRSSSALVGESSAIVRLREAIDQVAAVDVHILIEGEAGVGKELVALMLHRASARRAQPFVGVACGALTPDSAAHDLFGDAGLAAGSVPHLGQVESAHRGTLFLDDIDQLAPALQQRVLGVIETQSVTREGSLQATYVDIRLIATAREDLRQAVAAGHFREDLYHALNMVRLRIPPLRERRADIPLLFAHFVDEAATQMRRRPAAMTDATRRHLIGHDWPGNVRELKSFAFRAALGIEQPDDGTASEMPSLPDRVDRFEASAISAVLKEVKGNAAEAIRRLGLPRKTFYDKLHRHKIDIASYRG